MRFKVLGSGDAFGSGGRFNTSFHLTTRAGAQVLVDCGATTMVAMRRFGVSPEAVDAVVISHLHGDHFGGLPFLLLHQQYTAERTRPLTIAGPRGIEAATLKALEIFFGGIDIAWAFPLRFVEMTPGTPTEVAGLRVESFPVVHGQAPSHALRIADGETVFAYSGDTTWTPVLVEVARDADLFVMECYAFEGVCPTHTDWRTLSAHLSELTARRIRLTHMNADMLDNLDKVRVPVLEDGMELDLSS